jgi:methylated-DNA-[protein]-cysteine S-methyltransferase
VNETTRHRPHATDARDLWREISVVTTRRGVAGIWLGEGSPWGPTASDDPLAARALAQLREYLAGQRTRFDLPLDLTIATPFRRAVLEALLTVPFGTTVSYADLAERTDSRSPRAVGQAVGWNPLPIVVPCHRVVTRNGRLGGYSGGIERKVALLGLEGTLSSGTAFTSRLARL